MTVRGRQKADKSTSPTTEDMILWSISLHAHTRKWLEYDIYI